MTGYFGPLYYDRQGAPMEMMTWARAMEDPAAKIVEQTTLPGDVFVSTVWLGLNHNYGDGPPLIFETMIFGGDHNAYQDRYSTEAEARIAHKRIVANLRTGRDPWHYAHRLTSAEAREIRDRTRAGESVVTVAREFGVRSWAIQGIRDGRTWKHL